MKEKNVEYLIPLVKNTAQEISRRLGFNRNLEERRCK